VVDGEVFRARIVVRRESAPNSYGSRSGRQVDAVERVEDIGAELELEPLLDGDVLDNRQIDILEVWSVEFVSSEVALG